MSPWGVNPCREPNRSVPVAGIGSGSCWESLTEKGKYVINYSENIKGTPFGQQIRFSYSYDLRTWHPATDVPSFHEDGKMYVSVTVLYLHCIVYAPFCVCALMMMMMIVCFIKLLP